MHPCTAYLCVSVTRAFGKKKANHVSTSTSVPVTRLLQSHRSRFYLFFRKFNRADRNSAALLQTSILYDDFIDLGI